MTRNAMVATTIFLMFFSAAAFAEPQDENPEVRYVVTKIGEFAGELTDYGCSYRYTRINNRGQVVWLYVENRGRNKPDTKEMYYAVVLWEKGKRKILFERSYRENSNWNSVEIYDFNDAGQVIGAVRRWSPVFTEKALLKEEKGWPKRALWRQAFLWTQDGESQCLGSELRSVSWEKLFLRRGTERLSAHNIAYLGRYGVINNRGMIACQGIAPDEITSQRGVTGDRGLFVAQVGSMGLHPIDFTALFRESGTGSLKPTAINDLGNVVGVARSGIGFVWWRDSGKVEKINPPTDSPYKEGECCSLVDINDRDQIVGADARAIYSLGGKSVVKQGLPLSAGYAWLWESGQAKILEEIAPGEFSEKSLSCLFRTKDKRPERRYDERPVFPYAYPEAINNFGQIVGAAGQAHVCLNTTFPQAESTAQAAVIWENGKVTELNLLVPNDAPSLNIAIDINDYGQIIAHGKDAGLYLLTPISLTKGKPVEELELPGKPKRDDELVALGD